MFEVDVAGLARKLGDRPPHLLVYELIQNAWDEPTCTQVSVSIITGTNGRAVVTVEDDADGFECIESAWTLFRDSKKAKDVTKRGRFELGEKLVVACSKCAVIDTVGHTVLFHAGQRRVDANSRRRGTRFTVELDAETALLSTACMKLIPPAHVKTIVNGQVLACPAYIERDTYLPTVQADDFGVLREVYRSTDIHVIGTMGAGMLYEMGVPVCELGVPDYHVDVQQRVPVDWGRQTAPPHYLRQLRANVLEAIASKMSPAAASAAWVTEALESVWVSPATVRSVCRARFGDRAVIDDPKDPEGTKLAVSLGYVVVPLNAFTYGAWRNIRDADALRPAGEVTPSYRPYGEGGAPERLLPLELWTGAMLRRAQFARRLHAGLLPDADVLDVAYVHEPGARWAATYGLVNLTPRLCVNTANGGDIWLARPNAHRLVIDLLLHEFAHNATPDHLAYEYHAECTRLGALAVGLALETPELFK